MATWAAFERAAPELAERGFELFCGLEQRPPSHDRWCGIGFLATVNADGGPRMAPVCPIVAEGRMFLAAVGAKVADLDRDGRYVLHAFLGRDDAEFSMRGRARRVDEAELLQAVRETVKGTGMLVDPEAGEVVVELDIERADAAVWENVGKPGTRAVRTTWREGDS